MPPEYQRSSHLCFLPNSRTMRTHADTTHRDKVCGCSRAKTQSGPQLCQKADLQILQKVLSRPEVSRTGSIMAALLPVGWLCPEECTNDRGGSLWLSQTVPVLVFCPVLSLFQVALALIRAISIPGVILCHLRQWSGSPAFSKYWTSYCHHQTQHTG